MSSVADWIDDTICELSVDPPKEFECHKRRKRGHDSSSITTTAPATVAPITTAPVTLSPVTLAPVTLAPVTLAPVTLAPITVSPTISPLPPPVTLAPFTATPTATTTMHPFPETVDTMGSDLLEEPTQQPIPRIVFVPSNFAMSCVAVILGTALAVYFGLSLDARRHHADRKPSEEGPLIQLEQREDSEAVAVAYGSTN